MADGNGITVWMHNPVAQGGKTERLSPYCNTYANLVLLCTVFEVLVSFCLGLMWHVSSEVSTVCQITHDVGRIRSLYGMW